jgi:molybdopterin-guanine dinucleotide biosynthesis protein A
MDIGAFAVVVLAGGEGRRIGGGKPLRRLAGETLVARAVRTARGWSDEVRVAVRDEAQVEGVDVTLLHDDPEIEGPLAGIAAALRFARARGDVAVLTITCDSPFLPEDLATRFAAAIGDRAVAVAASGGRIHPACALWRVAALDGLPAYLATGRRALGGFAEAVGYVEVEWPAVPVDPFFNVNSAGDLERAEDMLTRR